MILFCPFGTVVRLNLLVVLTLVGCQEFAATKAQQPLADFRTAAPASLSVSLARQDHQHTFAVRILVFVINVFPIHKPIFNDTGYNRVILTARRFFAPAPRSEKPPC